MSVDTPAVNDTATPAADATALSVQLTGLTATSRAAPQPALSFTRFTSRKPARLSKHFALVGNVLDKQSGGNMTAGMAEKLTVTLAEFAALLPTLKPNQATCYGIAGHDAARVVMSDAVTQASNGDMPVIARTRDYFAWPDGAGMMMLDYDAPPDRPALDMEGLRDALVMACLPLDSAPAIWRPSASSCIVIKGGAEMRGIAGQRLYIPVLDASDIERAGQVLFDRLWLAGHGRYELSKSGALLLRAPIDASVFQPERLDFCGGASLGAGLEQRLPTPVVFNQDAPYLDTRAALPDLDDEEAARLVELREAAKEPLRERQAQAKEAWIAARVNERISALPEPSKEAARPKLEAAYRQALEGGWLAPSFELTVKPKGGKAAKRITVADALAQKDKYHEATCFDPLEPDYPDGASRLVGWLNLKHKPPYIKSQAHGGIQYFLGVAPAAESAQPPETDDVAIHPDYCASQAGTFWIKHNEDGDKHVFLANFRAEIQSETLVDDGAVSTRRLEIAGSLATGDRLPLATCASGHFAQLNWVGEHWGTAAQIAPGIGLKDRLRYAIQVLSQNVQRRSVYAHTGWREVGSQWLYLSAGAGIGDAGAVAGIDMELPGSLADYELALSGHPAAAIKASLELLQCAPASISTPLFLAAYRAILSEALPVDFSLFLTGTTGSRKTELAALVQAHFGSRWHGKHLPAAWSSTANRLEQDAFRAKDAVLVVDDFCPGGSTHDVARLHKEADRLLRAQGNRAGRGRMNADCSPRPAYYPRGLIVATGEDVPRGQSLRGRLLVLEFAPDTVNLPALTAMQQHAGTGRLAAAAGAFCQWLAPQLAELKKTLPARFRQKRAELMGAGAHSRHPDTLAELIITAEMFAQFAADAGVTLAPDWLATIADALLQAGKEQAQFIATEEPAGRFVRLIISALAAGLCHVKRKDGREPYTSESEMSGLGWQLRSFGSGEHAHDEWIPQGPAIGWFEEHNLYLEPDAAYRTTAKFADDQGQALPLTQRSLFKAMESKGLIRSKQPNRITNNIRVGGEIKRVLHISRVYGENSGYNGYSGYKAQQPNDCKDENPVADSGYSENLAATSATDFADADPCVATVAGNVADKKTERLQNSECNYTADKDFSGPVADVADVAAFPHPLPLQSFPGDEFPAAVATSEPRPPALTPPPVSVLSGDAALLAPVLAMYRGEETEQRLAQKMGWGIPRLVGAVGILVTAGYAEYRSGRVRPVGRLVQ